MLIESDQRQTPRTMHCVCKRELECRDPSVLTISSLHLIPMPSICLPFVKLQSESMPSLAPYPHRQVIHTVSDTYSGVTSVAGDAINNVKDTAGGAIEHVTSATSSAVDSAQSTARGTVGDVMVRLLVRWCWRWLRDVGRRQQLKPSFS